METFLYETQETVERMAQCWIEKIWGSQTILVAALSFIFHWDYNLERKSDYQATGFKTGLACKNLFVFLIKSRRTRKPLQTIRKVKSQMSTPFICAFTFCQSKDI